jgi:trigger factor
MKGKRFMKSNLEDISSVEKKITVTIDKKQVAAEYGKRLSDAAKSASIKGFRKGKAPKSMIEKYYGSKIEEETIKKLIEVSFAKPLDENGLKPIAQPMFKAEKFSKDNDFTYSMIVELMPEFELSDYSGLDLKSKKAAVGKSETEEALEKLRQQNAIFKETTDDKKVEKDDMVIFDFKGYLSDGKLIKDGEKNNFSVVIGSNTLIPDFEDNLIGLKKGEEKEFVITFPKDYFEKEYAGADVKFQIKINEIKEKELPALDDDFAKDFGDFKILDDLKSFIKDKLVKRKEHESKTHLREQIVEKLIESNKFDVPKCLVEKQLDYMIQNTRQKLQSQGADISALNMSEEDMRENSRELAIKMVKRDMVLDKIIKAEELTVEESELEEKYDEMAKNLNKPVQSIKDYYKRLNAERYLKEEILIQKVYGKIIQKADITEGA